MRKRSVMRNSSDETSPLNEARQSHQDGADEAGSPIDESSEGFPVCQWCGGTITEKEDLVVASDETGAPTRIAPVGYTAPRTFATYHRECHFEATGELPAEEIADASQFWTPVNTAIVGVTLVVVLVVLYFALFPQ